jgi:DNA-binding NarL/FixJ family response regulator
MGQPMKSDAFDLLIRGLEDLGHEPHDALRCAEWLMRQMEGDAYSDVYLSVLARRRKVYKLRNEGVSSEEVAKRLRMCVRTVRDDYRAEMLRHRKVS